ITRSQSFGAGGNGRDHQTIFNPSKYDWISELECFTRIENAPMPVFELSDHAAQRVSECLLITVGGCGSERTFEFCRPVRFQHSKTWIEALEDAPRKRYICQTRGPIISGVANQR